MKSDYSFSFNPLLEGGTQGYANFLKFLTIFSSFLRFLTAYTGPQDQSDKSQLPVYLTV